MADFSSNHRKCRIDPAIGSSVMCTFEAEQEAEIYRLLRKFVCASGIAVLEPDSNRVDSLRVSSIAELPSLTSGNENFFADLSVRELAAAQNVYPVIDASELSGGFPPEEDIDEFLKDVYEARR